MGQIEARLKELGIELPRPTTPLATYAPVTVARGFAFVSGHGPIDSDGTPIYTGRVGVERTEEEGIKAAELAALNSLASLKAALGSLDRVRQVVKLLGFVLSEPGFKRQPWIINGASNLLQSVFGPEKGRHSRTALGTISHPLDLTVTIEMIVEVDDE